VEKLLAAGVMKYLTKPLNIAEFLRTLDEALVMKAA
jgi:DNA-binding response OmpR family regulator